MPTGIPDCSGPHMKSVGWPRYFGYTLFCDEIRREDSGKFILIGVYDETMILFQPLPYIHKNIATRITYSEAIEEKSHDVEIHIIGPKQSEPTAVYNIDSTAIEDAKSKARASLETTDVDGELRVIFNLNWNTTPFPITAEGRLKVRAYRNGEELKMGTLAIKVHDEIKKKMAEKMQE